MMTTVASSERRDATTRPAVPPPMTVNVSKVRMEMEISVVTHYDRICTSRNGNIKLRFTYLHNRTKNLSTRPFGFVAPPPK
jgi:hypothetical protein